MSRVRWAIFLCAIYGSRATCAPLDGIIRRIIAQSRATTGASVGVLIVDEKGHRLAAIDSDRAFIPASNTKLFSIAFALESLGPDKRLETRVEQRGDDLALIGTGDANLALPVVDDLAAQIAARGIQQIAGDVIGDDTAFLYEPFARGWTAEDVFDSDGAPVSALVVNDNAVRIRLTPAARDGDPATGVFDPPFSPFALENRVTTGAPEAVHAERLPATNLWRLWGTIPAGADPVDEHWAVNDAAEFAATALKDALERHGVRTRGRARAVHRLAGMPFTPIPAGPLVAIHQSPPLVEDLRLTAKVSQNLHADLLLFDVAGSREKGLERLAAYLAAIGLPEEDFRFYDGSGLSRMNLVTPRAVVGLLRHMLTSRYREDWLSLLPIAGVDGSLMARMTGARLKGRIRAKTGSLNHVSALAGYAITRKGRVTFSIMVNNATAPAAAQRELIDKICAVLMR